MKAINLTNNIRLVERFYHANNHLCHDYAVLFTKNGEERFCGYYRAKPSVDEIDYEQLFKAYERNVPMPEWDKEQLI